MDDALQEVMDAVAAAGTRAFARADVEDVELWVEEELRGASGPQLIFRFVLVPKRGRIRHLRHTAQGHEHD
jgi:hypothetical protein